MTNRALEIYNYQHDEPTVDPFARVRYKRDWRSRRLIEVQAKVTSKSEEEENAKQDAHLLKHGVK